MITDDDGQKSFDFICNVISDINAYSTITQHSLVNIPDTRRHNNIE